MNLLIACPRKLLLVDTQTAASYLIESHRPEYYGISWDRSGQNLILGHSGIDNSSLQSLESYVDSECGWISHGRQRGPSVLSQAHQILSADDKLIATNTGRNSITVFRTDDWFYRQYWIDDIRWDRKGKQDPCGRHLNSLFLHRDQLHVIAHNYDRGSELIRFFWPEMEVIQIEKTNAEMAHNIWVTDEGQRIICDSMRGRVVDLDQDEILWQSRTPNVVTRGLASDGHHVFIGQSAIGPRQERTTRDSHVWIVELGTWKTLDCIRLPNSGNIHEVRLIDEPDHCHHRQVYRGPLSHRLAA
ncbi:MAG: hypothetical protein GY768_15195 [Planctomycetaceae bacterium]|nr:hypothetical protein [Planctomycetaceae bacterium]